MTFREWQSLSPEAAAREVHRRAAALLSPAQRRAAIESLIPLEQLAANFDAARGAGPLAGVPYLAKDLFDVANLPTFAGSTFLPEVRPTPTRDGAFVRAVGATGAVGAEMLRCLEESSYPTGVLKAFASERSAGKRFKFRGRDVEMQVLTEDAFAGCDVVLFASETDISKQYVPIAVKAGAYAIDNSSAFRMDASVPLVVPEVNGDLITPTQKIYANPNCVAAIMVMALWPLHQAGKLKRVGSAIKVRHVAEVLAGDYGTPPIAEAE